MRSEDGTRPIAARPSPQRMASLMSAAVSVTERKQGALLGLLVGDALAMPVHWYYSLGQLKRDYCQVRAAH